MLFDFCLVWSVTFIIILDYELLHIAYVNNKPIPHLLMAIREVVLTLCGIFYYVSSAFLGAFAVLYCVNPTTMLQGRIEATFGILLGIWGLAIFLQVSLNLARIALGAPRQPVVYFNKRAFTFGWLKNKNKK